MAKSEVLDSVNKLAKTVDMKLVNDLLSQTELRDFEMNKSTITNIAEWCLNGESDNEIRKRLSLNKHQWAILVTVCPTLLIIMKDSRALADVVIAGSLFQTAVGGKRIKKQQPMRVKEYDEKGIVIGEHYEIVEYEEELPPNPLLLKFLAEHKMSEKLGDVQVDKESSYKKMVDSLSPDERALIEAMKKASDLNANK
ncbi:MAG: hypothetical protein J6S85_17925 [Methanobrevibacter sp.]|nr:hypothetical protein [Methanobrevibacter sp.]